ncbi:MAG: hypothetical protein NTU44_14850 [Bacteroidetes bacterium]|nr:hypothetical protein [Bacteroidota bacterium]
MNKSFYLSFFLIVWTVGLYAQEINVKDAWKLKTETIYLILNKNDETNYSKALKKSMEKFWTFNKYEIVYKEDLEKKLPGRYEKSANLMGYFIMDITNLHDTWLNLKVFGRYPGLYGHVYRYPQRSIFIYSESGK